MIRPFMNMAKRCRATQCIYLMVGMAAWRLPASVYLQFLLQHLEREKVESDNPWQSTTLEWAAPTPPPHGNFTTPPEVYRGPYEYSVPGDPEDYSPQFEKVRMIEMEIPYAVQPHPITGIPNGKLGDLAVSRIGSHAIWRAFFSVNFAACWC